MKSATEKAKLVAEHAGSSETADSSDGSAESAGQGGVKPQTARNERNVSPTEMLARQPT